jgi:threonine dehydratase
LNASPPVIADVRAAQVRIAPYIHRTPVLTSAEFNALAGADLFFKCENFQKVGAFKARGAHNAVFSLSESEAARGVLTHSSGNHGAAVALAARCRGITAHIVVPENAMRSKVASIERYGGKVTFCPPTSAEREAMAAALLAKTGACLVHPYDDPAVIAGQGTAALEFLEAVPDLQIIMAPIGGGGLLSGTAIAAKALSAAIRVFGAEPIGANDAAQSLRAGHIVSKPESITMADGLRSARLGDITFAVLRRELEDIVTVTEESIVEAMRLVWQIMKIVIEPSAAVAVAALFARPEVFRGKRVGVILSGGNVDLDHLPWKR